MYTEFKIKQLSSWAVIELACDENKYEFWASYITENSFENLIEVLTGLVSGEKNNGIATFNLESQGFLEMVFCVYPNQLIKFEVYEGILWEDYDELFQDQPVPVPVFQTIMPEIKTFAGEVIKEMERYGKEGFNAWDNNFFDEQLVKLKSLISFR